MGKYKIHIYYPEDGPRGYEEVKGYPVSIPWINGIGLFAHRPYNGGAGYWNISEVKSGLSLIANCLGTKEQALDALKARLASVQTNDVGQFIKVKVDKHIAEFGIANIEVLGGK